MRDSFSRRRFLQSTSAAGSLGVLGASWLNQVPAVTAEETKPDPKSVVFTADIEPTVQLLENTQRDKLLEEVAGRIRKGKLNYQQVVTALQLAGIRNVQPRPSVGFKFHAVLVVNSAHLASLASADEDRWLPIFWALDAFKESQAKDVSEGNWTMPAVATGKLPAPHEAREQLTHALEKWDAEQADVAAAILARTASAGDIFELLCRYGARDFRAIGHKIIYVANAFRALQVMGWQHAEPVIRSLAYAILNHQGEDNPANNDYAADRPYKENQKRIKAIRNDWQDGKVDAGATKELLVTLRTSSAADACEAVVQMLNQGVAPQSIWDGMLVGGGELLMRQPGIVGLHTLTTSNAIHYAYQNVQQDETRRLLLLQNAAFLTMFRDAMEKRGKVSDAEVLKLEPADKASVSLDEIFADVSGNRDAAARATLAYAKTEENADEFIRRARLLVFLKGRDSHDYKFSSAVLEDYRHLSPEWRDRFLATSVYNLRGSKANDNELVARTRQAFSA
ncbi:hypothetical protein ETAA8_35400 [Anatilimnocola aggregata]|uniref:Twin-arginine translocation signal domain-containing protein n=1 Tax=Anatilimnocola aggregata TaxID=2528021 RepID=A0A517YDX8_9BACT|nr:twin-arginine translocation signal domain-containing protein [Anatilimnocola aggregata]QDU28440.1 hypothetical protein ETAA8_35400 [Anatilimnocola aggregata]